MEEFDRQAVLTNGSGSQIIASNKCSEFPFRLMKMQDPRTDANVLAQYNPNLVVYVGARNWNKFKSMQGYTSAAQLKFSNIKVPGDKFLIGMKWWLDYKVTITFKDFPYPVDSSSGCIPDEGFMSDENIFQLRPYSLHQCTENIHLRINNKDITSYPIQTLNQRMKYWRQAKLMDSGGVCPHRKPSAQSTYGTAINDRSTFMNIGSTYDGDMGMRLSSVILRLLGLLVLKT